MKWFFRYHYLDGGKFKEAPYYFVDYFKSERSDLDLGDPKESDSSGKSLFIIGPFETFLEAKQAAYKKFKDVFSSFSLSMNRIIRTKKEDVKEI